MSKDNLEVGDIFVDYSGKKLIVAVGFQTIRCLCLVKSEYNTNNNKLVFKTFTCDELRYTDYLGKNIKSIEDLFKIEVKNTNV